jgi:hypothetical protein
MRQLLGVVGREVGRLLWVVKGLLLLGAVAALAVWPVGRGRFFVALGDKVGVPPQRVVAPGAGVEWGDGWISGWYGPTDLPGLRGGWGSPAQAVRHGGGWVLENRAGTYPYYPAPLAPKWGPFRWFFPRAVNPLIGLHVGEVGARCWLVAAVLGAWPSTSVVLAVRRRRRRRRERVGCCRRCGYDLRATPSGGGEVLARCPECGTWSPEVTLPL